MSENTGFGHSTPRVAVVGGGFTGLTTAYELSKAGYAVDVYEAAPQVGGLAAGFTLDDGFPLEKAYHFLYTTDRHMVEMSEELGIRDKLHFHPSSIIAFHKGKRYGFTTPVDLLKFKPLSMVNRIRTGITGLWLQMIKNPQPLTKVTAYEYLCRVNGKKATDLVWKPLLVGKFDIYWDKVTMAWLWTRIHQRQTSKIKGELTERLGYFDGGFQIVVQRWLEELDKRGVRVFTGTQITRFDERDGKPVITVGGEEKQYDSVLAALPSNVFAKLTAQHPSTTEAYQKQLLDIDHLGAVLMVMRTSEPITDTYWHQIHDDDAPFLVFLSLDSLVGIENTGGRHIYYVGDYTPNDSELMKASEEEIRSRWLAGVQRFFPDFDPSSVLESHIFKFRNAQHIVDVTYESRIPSLKTPLPGYYLSNFSQIFPEDRGTNLAVRDGLKVAKMIMEDLPLAAERAPASAPLGAA